MRRMANTPKQEAGTASRPVTTEDETKGPKPLSEQQTLAVQTVIASSDVDRKQLRDAGVRNPSDTAAGLVRRGLLVAVEVEGKRRTFTATSAGREAVGAPAATPAKRVRKSRAVK